MALIYCSACGKQVSDAAPVCPNCGHPIAGRSPMAQQPASPLPKGTAGRAKVWGIVAAVIIVLIVIVALNKPSPHANFKVASMLFDSSCTTLGDYCITVHCTYTNVGDGAGETTIRTQLLSGTSPVAERHDQLSLPAGQSQQKDFNFPEAVIEHERDYTGNCLVGSQP